MNDFAPRSRWLLALAIFGWVLAAHLWLTERAGTDVPFMDQWDVEGGWLYPRAVDGTLGASDLFQAHNEHRIVFTQALNLALFRMAAHWDPLLQLVAGALLHAALGALLVTRLGAGLSGGRRILVAAATAILLLPASGWHNALWGFQTQVYFVLLFAAFALAALARAPTGGRSIVWATLAGAASVLSMGAGLATPVALAVVALLPFADASRAGKWRRFLPVAIVTALAMLVWIPSPPGTGDLRATSPGEFLHGWARLLAWPWSDAPALLAILNLPWLLLAMARFRGRAWARGGTANLILGLGFWSALVSAAEAWARGGGAELSAGVPSRYTDFCALLPLANAAALTRMELRSGGDARVNRMRLAAGIWLALLIVGWGFAAESAWVHVIAPRIADRDRPERLLLTFAQARDPAVFASQPRLLVPHPDLRVVARVLDDPRLRHRLPPSVEPDEPLALVSQVVRTMLTTAGWLWLAATVGLAMALFHEARGLKDRTAPPDLSG